MTARPSNTEGAIEAVAHLGNLVKAAIIRYLREHPNSGRKDIIEGLGVPPSTIAPYLSELELAKLIIGNPPRTARRRGEWPVYRVNDEEVTALYLRLGQEIGEI